MSERRGARRRWGARLGLGALALVVASAGCRGKERVEATDAGAEVKAATSATASAAAPVLPVKTALRGPRSGSAIARDGDALYVADEDHRALRRFSLPLTADFATLPMPGAPAQIVTTGDAVLVTIRDPGLLLVLRPDGEHGLVEVTRVAVPDDAWGLAVTADASTAIVTSAWTHTVTGVDLASTRVAWSVEVAREPRGVVIPEGGDRAYVTHLVGSPLTRIDGLRGDAPKVHPVELPVARARAPLGGSLESSLGYAAVLDEGEARLFVPRLALGALASTSLQARSWFGAGTVDVLQTSDDTPLAEARAGGFVRRVVDFKKDADYVTHPSLDDAQAPLPLASVTTGVQPRAVVLRKTAKTLLVADEGYDRLVELDTLVLDPALQPLGSYPLAGTFRKGTDVAATGGAPSGIALSADERTAYVLCRATYDVVEVPLRDDRVGGAPPPKASDVRAMRFAEDPLVQDLAPHDPKRLFAEAASLGRGLFYNATDKATSGGLACAGCHPEGRDDGHTWHERMGPNAPGPIFVGSGALLGPGRARQTPMLAGRVDAKGPYGWHGESPTLDARIVAGFTLHRWDAVPPAGAGALAQSRAGALAAFLRMGLIPPPHPAHELTEVELRGREVFLDPESRCATCHEPKTGYTARWLAAAGVEPRDAFAVEPVATFKTPSLLFVAGTPPYFHDGSVATLEQLVLTTGDRMGKTSHLSESDKRALAAYLRTL